MVRKTLPVLLIFLSAPGVFSQEQPPSGDGPRPVVEYYGELGCSHCDEFEEKILPAAEKSAGIDAVLKTYDILSAEGYERCERRVTELGYEFTIFPVAILGEHVYQGNSAIEENIAAELAYFKRHGKFRGPPSETPPVREESFSPSFIPIFAAGLVDGINPCAFTTLLFFVSFIGLQAGTRDSVKERRRKIAAAGGLFTLGIFVAYFLIGLGIFNLLRLSMDFSLLRLLLKIVVTILTAGFLVFTIRDYIMIRRGKAEEMSLQLPKGIKRRIHAVIRRGTVSAVFVAGTFITGIIVALLELACTGQVYFPAISFMVQTDTSLLGIGSLLLYNVAFILPMIAVLVTILFGITDERIKSFFSRRIGLSKIALAVIFTALAVLIWIF